MRIRVEGGRALTGVYRPSGNTNAAVALLAAALLTDQPVTFKNLPRTNRVHIMLELARWLGTDFKPDDADSGAHTLTLHTPQIAQRSLSPEQTNGYVGALLYIAPILTRREYLRLEVDFPLNRVRTHLDAMRDLGLDVVVVEGAIEIRAVTWDYKDIILTQTSVTATAITVMLAVAFGKETIIRNTASEPHIQELCLMLEHMGAQIEGIGSNVLHIFGAESLGGLTVTVGPDHIEAASIAALSAMTRGRVQIEDTRERDLRMIDRIYRRLGIMLDIDETTIFVPKHDMLAVSNREEDVDSSIQTAPWPGFPSDLVAVATVIATQARGTSLIHEWMYNNRLLFVDKLNAMGAQIVLCDPHRAIVVGPTPLYPIYMDTPDVRAGMGLLAAALIADGASVIDNAQAISQSFEGVFGKLQALGAKITVE